MEKKFILYNEFAEGAIELDTRLMYNEIVDEYDKLRPTFKPEIYSNVLAYSNINNSSNVLEIGIGTGKATLPFLEMDCRLTAIEIGDKLAEYSRLRFAGYKNLNIITTSFEDFNAPDKAFDLIYAASSFHWIPEDEGYPKVYKLLKNGGTFARFGYKQWKDKENEPLSEAIQKVYEECLPEFKMRVTEYGEEDCEKTAEISKKYGFANIEYKLYQLKRTFNAENFLSLLRTYVDHTTIEEKRWAIFAEEIKKVINNYGGSINVFYTMYLILSQKP